MKKLIPLFLILLGLPLSAFAQLNTHGGGTGLVNVAQGSIPFGSVFNIRLATSSDLQFSNSASRLSFKYGSSTDTFSVPTLCLTGDVCRTTWPTGGGGSGAATTSFAATAPIQVTPTSAAITYSILAASASQAGSMSAADFQLLHTATSTFTSPIIYTQGTNAVTCQVATASVPGCLAAADFTTFNSKASAFAPYFTWNLLNTYSTSTAATTTSLWTQGVFFSSSTKAASQFPYATTTSITIQTLASTTGLIVSGPATTTFSGNGIDLNSGTGCFAIAGTCLQTIISSATAYKQAVKYASTSTLPSNTYNNGANGVGATITGVALAPLFIDSNTAALGDRILVKNEGTGANNGIYTVTTAGVGGITAFVLTRATDYNSSLDVFPGVASFTNSGAVNANTCWILTNTTAVTIGTTALTYDDACGAGSYTGTSPIIVTGTVISIQAASAAQAGSMAAGDFQRLYTATTTFTSPIIYTQSSNAVTCQVATASVPGCLAASDWNTFNNKVATSSSETAANIPWWTTTNGVPAQQSGGDTTFTFTSASKKLTFLNGTSTNLSATGSFFAPTITALPVSAIASSVSIDTSIGSSSLQVGAFGVYATSSISFMWSTTTAATDTIPFTEGPRGMRITSMGCEATGGKGTIAIGNGIATSTYLACSSTGVKSATISNSFDAWTRFYVAIGSYDVGTVSVSPAFGYEYTY